LSVLATLYGGGWLDALTGKEAQAAGGEPGPGMTGQMRHQQ
jgi:hypothetical protein